MSNDVLFGIEKGISHNNIDDVGLIDLYETYILSLFQVLFSVYID